MAMTPDPSRLLSVAVCTWNRCGLLRQTLEDMSRLVIPPAWRWELLVVDNNCTDATPRVLDEFAGRLPLRVLREPRQGLSHARNAAVRACGGEYILWTDDDVRLDPQWMAAYVQAFGERPDAAFFGGPIRPQFEKVLPPWLQRVWPRVATAYGERELGPVPIRFDGLKLTPFGANFAVKAEEQRRRPYSTRLGRRANSLVSGEETALVEALITDGHEGWWVPGSAVGHVKPAHQLSTRYLRRYFMGLGQTLALTEPARPEGAGPRLRGHSISAWREALEQEYDYRVARWRLPPERWINELIRSSITWGRLSVR